MSISPHVNRKEAFMSSSKSGSAEPSAGGRGIFIALIPWIVFTVLASHATLKIGSLVALGAAIVIAVPGIRAGRPKLLEVGAVVTFVGFVVVAFLADGSTAHWVARYARGIAALILSLISFASLFFTPFTEQYAREKVPEQYWGSPKFKAINRKLTTMWACIFAAMVPFQDPKEAVRKLRRAREELGFVSAFVRPNPCLGRTIVDPCNDGFWEEAESLGMTVAIHEGFQNAVPPLGSDRTPTNVLVLHACSHTLEQMLACAQLIGLGILERHPTLRFVFLEAGGGWAPYWLERLDHQVPSYHRYAPPMSLLPSEYFARQCWVSFEVDEPTLPALAPFIGESRIVWGSDYPHADSTFPGATAELFETVSGLEPEAQRRILGLNAAELYGLEAHT